MAIKTKTKSVQRTTAQIEIVCQVNDLSFENPKLTFEQVAQKALGPDPFQRTANGRKFKKECRAVFDREREA
jgi:hypothetical protein